jgi:hypothetical protein
MIYSPLPDSILSPLTLNILGDADAELWIVKVMSENVVVYFYP